MQKETVFIDEKKLNEIIINYYTNDDSEVISVDKELIKIHGDLRLTLFLIKDDQRFIITYEDLEYVLKYYLHYLGYEFINYKFVGGIHNAGYYFDEDTPHFDGVSVTYRNHEKTKKLVP